MILISLSPQTVTSIITVPEMLAGSWSDKLSAETIRVMPSFHLTMVPCQVRVLVRTGAGAGLHTSRATEHQEK